MIFGQKTKHERYAYNLLDNSDFRNPVNQRGAMSYTLPSSTWINTLDRWLLYGTGATLSSDGGLKIVNDGTATCGLVQRIDCSKLKEGTLYTFAFKGRITGKCKMSYGISATANTDSSDYLEEGVNKVHTYTFTPEATNAMYNVRIRSEAIASTMELEWAALYEGEYTDETLPEYLPKGYACELMECQRYYLRYSASSNMQFASGASNSGQVYAPVTFAIPFVKTPQLEYSSLTDINIYPYAAGGNIPIDSLAIEARATSNNCVVLMATHTEGALNSKTPACIRILAGGYIAFSADL